MKSFLAFLILSLPFLAFASPTVSARDACRTIPVSEVRQVYEQHPETTGDQQMVAPNVPGCWGVFQTQVNESTINGVLHLHTREPSILKFNVPATATRCQLALSDTMGTRDFQTSFDGFNLAPTINVASLGSLVPGQWTFNGIYNTPGGIKNPEVVSHFDPNPWEGELQVWDVECPTPVGGEYLAYFSVELNTQSLGGDGVYGIKTYQILETIPGKLGAGDDTFTVYNGFHMLIDC